MEENEIYCLKCKSKKLHSDTKGFSAGKAIVGGILTGGIGLLAGFHGSKKINITCLNCGNKFTLQESINNKNLLETKEKERIIAEKTAKVDLENRIRNKPSDEEIEKETLALANTGSTKGFLVANYKKKMVVDDVEAVEKVLTIINKNPNMPALLLKNANQENTTCLVFFLLIVAIIIALVYWSF